MLQKLNLKSMNMDFLGVTIESLIRKDEFDSSANIANISKTLCVLNMSFYVCMDVYEIPNILYR